MKLPVPYRVDRMIIGADSGRLKGMALADASKARDNGEPWLAMHILASGGVSALVDEAGGREEDRGQIKTLLLEGPYVNTEYLSLMALASIGADDPIDMICTCPVCKTKTTQQSPRLRDLPLVVSELEEETGPVPVVPEPLVKLEYPIEIVSKSTRERTEVTLLSASEILFEIPTLRSLIAAQKRVGLNDTTRLQYFAWAQSIREVDGEPVDDKWRLQWWDKLFERMDLADVRTIAKALTDYGLDNRMEVVCAQCGKKYHAVVPTQDFFASGLQGAQ
jgi:hypothetical protein